MSDNAPQHMEAGLDPNGASSFEASLEALHRIVSELETGSLTLDDTIRKFQEGSALAAECLRRIESAELRVTELTTATDGASSPMVPAPDDRV